MSRDETLWLDDIQASCEKVLRYAADMSREEFFADEKTVDAVIPTSRSSARLRSG